MARTVRGRRVGGKPRVRPGRFASRDRSVVAFRGVVTPENGANTIGARNATRTASTLGAASWGPMNVHTLARFSILLALPIGLAFCAPTTAHALDCGDRLVTLGESRSERAYERSSD